MQAFREHARKLPGRSFWTGTPTDLPLHGKNGSRLFHGYYDQYCYLPLYIFCGEHVLCARLRIRVSWPEVKIILRGDSGFCRNEPISWCETQGVDFVLGLAPKSNAAQDYRSADGRRYRTEPDRQARTGVHSKLRSTNRACRKPGSTSGT